MSAQASQDMISATGAESADAVGVRRSNVIIENLPVIIGLVGAIVAILTPIIAIMIWVSSMNADMVDRFAAMEKRLTAQISELDSRLTAQISELDSRLTAQISELDSRLTARINELDGRLTRLVQAMDAKLNAIGDMTLLAYNDGEIDSSELAMIWEQARNRPPAAEPESE